MKLIAASSRVPNSETKYVSARLKAMAEKMPPIIGTLSRNIVPGTLPCVSRGWFKCSPLHREMAMKCKRNHPPGIKITDLRSFLKKFKKLPESTPKVHPRPCNRGETRFSSTIVETGRTLTSSYSTNKFSLFGKCQRHRKEASDAAYRQEQRRKENSACLPKGTSHGLITVRM
ncbi:MAG: hypothetical protein CME26_00865 [Gemmatimonadetes bacterium]|nr:hypothetical protein [Gemmatimonadota bacterium]